MTVFWAQTARELSETPVQDHPAYLGLRFSPAGLVEIPCQLPKGCLLILEDSRPFHPETLGQVLDRLGTLAAEISAAGVLLDFVQPRQAALGELVQRLLRELPCPVAAGPAYADSTCPLFLPPPPLREKLSTYLAPYAGREIWLEMMPQWERLTLTAQGCTRGPEQPQALPFWDEHLLVRYGIHHNREAACFSLGRDRNAWDALLSRGESLGVTRAVALYQEWMQKPL